MSSIHFASIIGNLDAPLQNETHEDDEDEDDVADGIDRDTPPGNNTERLVLVTLLSDSDLWEESFAGPSRPLESALRSRNTSKAATPVTLV